jgi:hypothetical protein
MRDHRGGRLRTVPSRAATGSIADKGALRKSGMWLDVCALSEKLKKSQPEKFLAQKINKINLALAFLQDAARGRRALRRLEHLTTPWIAHLWACLKLADNSGNAYPCV